MATESTSVPTGYAHIVCTPDCMGGEPRIDGHRIRVRDVGIMRDQGHTPEQIVSDIFPSLSLAEVYAALVYYEDHRDEMARLARREMERAAQFKQEYPHLVHDMRREANEG